MHEKMQHYMTVHMIFMCYCQLHTYKQGFVTVNLVSYAGSRCSNRNVIIRVISLVCSDNEIVPYLNQVVAELR